MIYARKANCYGVAVSQKVAKNIFCVHSENLTFNSVFYVDVVISPC